MFLCAKTDKTRGGPMPYPAKPLKQWMSCLHERRFGLDKLIMLWPYACFVSHGFAVECWCHFVSACWTNLLWQRRHFVYSEYTPMKLLKGGGSLILIQIEAAFYDESFAAIQACVFLFYCCVFFYFYKWLKKLKNVQISVCVCIVKCQEEWGKYLSW